MTSLPREGDQDVGSRLDGRGKGRKRQHIALEYEGSGTGTELPVKVKQEFPSIHSSNSPCQYGGELLHSAGQHCDSLQSPYTSYPPTLVKAEPTEALGHQFVSYSTGATSYQATFTAGHPSFPYMHTAADQNTSTPSPKNPGFLFSSDPFKSVPCPQAPTYYQAPAFHPLAGCSTNGTTHGPYGSNGYSLHSAPVSLTASLTADPTSLTADPVTSSSQRMLPEQPPTAQFAGDFSFSPWGLAAGPPGGGLTFGSLAGVDMSQSLAEGPGLNVSMEEREQDDKKGILGTPSKEKSPRGGRRRVKREEEDDGWEPPLWRQQLENISKMREIRDAPVDLMGAHKNAEQTTHVTPEVRRYQVLVSLMLSSQTKDQITAQAMAALKKHGLTIENILNTPEEEVAKLIHPVGFWRKKADYIKRTSQVLLDKYGGDIPATMEGLCSLPGVGPKMSHLVMDIAWDNTSGIAVDTHVHRISHRLGWMRRATENPEVTRNSLEKWLPKSEWRELNWLLVGFGQQRCLPTAPKCRGCLNKDICPASKLKGGGPWGKKKKSVKKETPDQPIPYSAAATQ